MIKNINSLFVGLFRNCNMQMRFLSKIEKMMLDVFLVSNEAICYPYLTFAVSLFFLGGLNCTSNVISWFVYPKMAKNGYLLPFVYKLGSANFLKISRNGRNSHFE